MNFQKEGDSRVNTSKSYRQVEAHLEVAYRDTHREVDRDVYVDQDSTEVARAHARSRPDGHRSGLPKTITESSSIYESMPLTDDYRLQDIFYRACGSTAQSSDSARALELGKYNHLEKLTC
jgi:hypothetical protein